jgi:hypothetical protein
VHAAGEKRIRKTEGKVIIEDFDLCVVKGTWWYFDTEKRFVRLGQNSCQ